MSYFVYFDNNKQSFKFLKAEEGTTLSFNDNQFCIRKNNHIQQVLINGDDNIYTYYIIYSVLYLILYFIIYALYIKNTCILNTI